MIVGEGTHLDLFEEFGSPEEGIPLEPLHIRSEVGIRLDLPGRIVEVGIQPGVGTRHYLTEVGIHLGIHDLTVEGIHLGIRDLTVVGIRLDLIVEGILDLTVNIHSDLPGVLTGYLVEEGIHLDLTEVGIHLGIHDLAEVGIRFDLTHPDLAVVIERGLTEEDNVLDLSGVIAVQYSVELAGRMVVVNLQAV